MIQCLLLNISYVQHHKTVTLAVNTDITRLAEDILMTPNDS